MRIHLKYQEHTTPNRLQAMVPQSSVMLRIWLTTFRLNTEDANGNKWKKDATRNKSSGEVFMASVIYKRIS